MKNKPYLQPHEQTNSKNRHILDRPKLDTRAWGHSPPAAAPKRDAPPAAIDGKLSEGAPRNAESDRHTVPNGWWHHQRAKRERADRQDPKQEALVLKKNHVTAIVWQEMHPHPGIIKRDDWQAEIFKFFQWRATCRFPPRLSHQPGIARISD